MNSTPPDQPHRQEPGTPPGDPWADQPSSDSGAPPYGEQPPPPAHEQPAYERMGTGYQDDSGHRPSGSNGMAIGALVCGLLSIPLGFFYLGALLGLIGVILGVVGVKRAKTMHGSGKGMAIAGIVSGGLGLLIGIVMIVLTASLFQSDEFQRLLDEEIDRQEQLDQEG